MSGATLIVSGDFVKTGGMDRANYALADFQAAELAARPGVSPRPS